MKSNNPGVQKNSLDLLRGNDSKETKQPPIITEGVAAWLSVVGAGGIGYLQWCECRIKEGKGVELIDYIKEQKDNTKRGVE